MLLHVSIFTLLLATTKTRFFFSLFCLFPLLNLENCFLPQLVWRIEKIISGGQYSPSDSISARQQCFPSARSRMKSYGSNKTSVPHSSSLLPPLVLWLYTSRRLPTLFTPAVLLTLASYWAAATATTLRCDAFTMAKCLHVMHLSLWARIYLHVYIYVFIHALFLQDSAEQIFLC